MKTDRGNQHNIGGLRLAAFGSRKPLNFEDQMLAISDEIQTAEGSLCKPKGAGATHLNAIRKNGLK
jgi:hypothetical protein